MEKKNVYITGGTGQDARILSKYFLNKKKFNLIILSKKVKSYIAKEFFYNYLISDLRNREKLIDIFKSNIPDIIIHLASQNPSYEEKNLNIFYKNNFDASKNLIELAYEFNPYSKFIFANSSNIFLKKRGLVNEFSKKKISSNYTRFRIEFDKIGKSFRKNKNYNYTNVILFNHDSKFRNSKFLLPRLVKALKIKNTLFLNKISILDIKADFSHAEDICNGIFKISISKKRMDNIILSSGKCTRVNDILAYLINKKKLKLNLKFLKNKNDNCLIGDSSFAKKKLGWKQYKNIYLATKEIYEYN